MKARCEKCRFSEKTDYPKYLHCQRYPPALQIEEHTFAYPTVRRNDWCGEFDPYEEEEFKIETVN